MNPVQQAISRVVGFDSVLESVQSEYSETIEALEATVEEQTNELDQIQTAIEHVESQNALLQRQWEDLDYLNLYDIHNITEVIPIPDRKKHYTRLRRLRQENPLAKQAVKLILRFTLGKGVQISIGPDPDKEMEKAGATTLPPEDGNGDGPKLNGLFPGTQLGNGLRPLPRARKQVGEAEDLDDDDQLKEIISDFWKDPDNQAALTSPDAMKEWLDSVITDGESFTVAFTDEAAPYVKLTSIPVEEITDIVYDPENWKIPIYYKRQYQPMVFDSQVGYYKPQGNPKTKYYLDHAVTEEKLAEVKKNIHIKAEEQAPEEQRIFHDMINPLWTKKGKRGISELYASREWFRVYKEFIENRAAINAAATSIAYKRKIKAGPTGVAGFTGKLGGVNLGYDNPENATEIRRLTQPVPGAIYDTNPAVDLEWMKTDTGAADAKEDGRSLMAAAGAGIGIFIHYFGEGGDANLATAQSMELPMVKTFEDWQEWTNTSLLRLLKFVITTATDAENANTLIDRVSGTFPPLISQDVVKYTTAWSQITQNIASGNKVIRREAIRGALNVMQIPNIDALMAQIEKEEEVVEAQRIQRDQEMMDAMKNAPNPVQDGNGNVTDPMLKTIAKGKPEPERTGPKPPK